ncbi:DUF1152 domain-containing protein [Streptomyces sp. NPDC002994]|uniref:DUF1152 domain-containing protein n=1 Tax=Streptomyces sp. NPDC002994 TaxID=3154441 RepID=UPI0033AD9EC7
MTQLLIAAGGGGDPIGTALVHQATAPHEDAVVLTYAWERLTVDPTPGPLGPVHFTGLRGLTPHVYVVEPDSAPVPPAGSTLPRLAGQLPVRLGLLDPYAGIPGLARQIAEAADFCGADEVRIVDVGGDIVARGDEPTLASPLPDAMAVAACRTAGVPATVYLAGPGLDSEVPEGQLLPRLGDDYFTLGPGDTVWAEGLFDWHPSEASALLAAAARGLRGACVTRDTGAPVPLTDASARVYRIALDRVLELSPLARALYDASPGTLDAAEKVSIDTYGFSEVERERERARIGKQEISVTERIEDALPHLDTWLTEVRARNNPPGLEYVTFRCATEALGFHWSQSSRLRAVVAEHRPQLYDFPLLATRQSPSVPEVLTTQLV